MKTTQALQAAREALRANHEHHIAYDEYDGYAESDLQEQNLKAIALIDEALSEQAVQPAEQIPLDVSALAEKCGLVWHGLRGFWEVKHRQLQAFSRESVLSASPKPAAQPSADKLDAERYRWLLKKDMLFSWSDQNFTSIRATGTVNVIGLFNGAVGDAIDAAMLAATLPTGEGK